MGKSGDSVGLPCISVSAGLVNISGCGINAASGEKDGSASASGAGDSSGDGSSTPSFGGGDSSNIAKKSADGQQVTYGSTDLSQEALDARVLDNNKRNLYAVARYKYASGPVQTLVVNSDTEGHAEENTVSRLAELGVDPSQVTDLYVEFQPCSGTVNCTDNVIPKFRNPDFKLTYSFEWNSDPNVQSEAQSGLKEALKELWP